MVQSTKTMAVFECLDFHGNLPSPLHGIRYIFNNIIKKNTYIYPQLKKLISSMSFQFVSAYFWSRELENHELRGDVRETQNVLIREMGIQNHIIFV